MICMGKIEKGIKCSLIGCEKIAVRSVSAGQAASSGLKVEDQKRTYLCDDHYKEFKKKSKGARQVEKWRWSA